MESETLHNTETRHYSYSRWRLYVSALIAASLFIVVGLFMGWPSPALVLLQPRNFTSAQYALLASIPALAPGPLITMFGIDLIGRKFTLFLIWLIILISYIIMIISEDVYALLAARFIGGWGMGASFPAVGIYISEISDVHSRSSLNSMSMILFGLGTVIVCSVGPFTSIKVISIVSLAVTLIFGILFWYLPESPYHLINKGQNDEAYTTLVWLRKNASKRAIDDEIRGIQFSIDEEKKQKIGIKKIFTSKVVWKQFRVAWYILAIQQLSGVGAIGAYTQTIFENAKLKFDAAYMSIALSIISVLLGFPTPFLVKRFGNRKLFIFASIGGAAMTALLGVYFMAHERGYDISTLSWFPCVVMFFYLFFTFTGYGSLVWAVVSDIFSPSVKGYATGISGIISTFLGFLATQIFGQAIYEFNFGPTFLVWSLVYLIGSFGVFYIPDLTHMSLQEIQEYFEGKR